MLANVLVEPDAGRLVEDNRRGPERAGAGAGLRMDGVEGTTTLLKRHTHRVPGGGDLTGTVAVGKKIEQIL